MMSSYIVYCSRLLDPVARMGELDENWSVEFVLRIAAAVFRHERGESRRNEENRREIIGTCCPVMFDKH